jgi:hypothetical protein
MFKNIIKEKFNNKNKYIRHLSKSIRDNQKLKWGLYGIIGGFTTYTGYTYWLRPLLAKNNPDFLCMFNIKNIQYVKSEKQTHNICYRAVVKIKNLDFIIKKC